MGRWGCRGFDVDQPRRRGRGGGGDDVVDAVGGGGGGVVERVGQFEDRVKVFLDKAADALGLDEVVGLGGGGEGVGSEQDAAVDFGAEVGAAVVGVEGGGGGLVWMVGGGGGADAGTVADAVVFREVGRGFGGGEDIVGG